ncbi:unnamed protein product [Lactuca virosa]|uniref:Uncharacterized protein n=1 Tax=Lactuca virosa TaxID=75947 RepID=A0AAU9MGK6_9ASTR|nr:unnamed protein product [Lactuca virosa]
MLKSPIRSMTSLEPVNTPVSMPNQPLIITDNMLFLGDSTSINVPISEVWRPTPSSSMPPPPEFSTNNQQPASIFTQTSILTTIQATRGHSAFACAFAWDS